MEGQRRYEDGIAAEVCAKKERAAAQERGEKEGRRYPSRTLCSRLADAQSGNVDSRWIWISVRTADGTQTLRRKDQTLVGGAKGWLHHSQPGECLKQPISVCPHGRDAAHCTASLVQKGKTYSYSHTLGEETEDDTARSRGPLMVNHSLYLIQSPFSPKLFFSLFILGVYF
ncbi:hypothetical protein DPX16_15613 [Anabarilius grahami]|uniref:Uncharacterized protein n=1 Tax=Anabarilius grahami TaxID=495550 RepID=A0A3N0YE39_ANAGA|nr:hypothetical protein DPX16_15613 [Anabarilius grahami]